MIHFPVIAGQRRASWRSEIDASRDTGGSLKPSNLPISRATASRPISADRHPITPTGRPRCIGITSSHASIAAAARSGRRSSRSGGMRSPRGRSTRARNDAERAARLSGKPIAEPRGGRMASGDGRTMLDLGPRQSPIAEIRGNGDLKICSSYACRPLVNNVAPKEVHDDPLNGPVEGFERMGDIDRPAQLAGPPTIGELPGGMGRDPLKGIKGDFLMSEFVFAVCTWRVPKCPVGIHERFDRLFARDLLRPIRDIVRVRPPPPRLVCGCPGDAVVSTVRGTRHLVIASMQIRESGRPERIRIGPHACAPSSAKLLPFGQCRPAHSRAPDPRP